MMAYLMMMAIRLKELHRVLKPTMKRPFLIGERVYLRPLEEEDIDRCLVWINNPEITATPTLRKRNGEGVYSQGGVVIVSYRFDPLNEEEVGGKEN